MHSLRFLRTGEWVAWKSPAVWVGSSVRSKKSGEVRKQDPSLSTGGCALPPQGASRLPVEHNHPVTESSAHEAILVTLRERALPRPSLFGSLFHPHALQNFRSLSSFRFCSFVKIISLQVPQSFFEDAQRHKALLWDCIPGRFKEVAENESRVCPRARGPLRRERGALACEGAGVCNHTAPCTRAHNLWGLRGGRFSFLH